MKRTTVHPILLAACAALLATSAAAQEPAGPAPGFGAASRDVRRDLDGGLAELSELRERIAAEKIPLARELRELEDELVAVRGEYQQVSRLLDSRTLDLGNLRTEIGSRSEEIAYLSNLLGEYVRNFE
jgi:biopolymer transport protein ExbB